MLRYCSLCEGVVSFSVHLFSFLFRSKQVWPCEFCGQENKIMSTDPGAKRTARQNLPGRDIIYLSEDSDGDYINLEDMLVVFCVDISGSMSVTYEVPLTHTFVQDALQRALSSLLHSSPHRRVALVTFNDEVTVYGDGTGAPLTLRDWSLVDFDHLKEQGKQYCTPHCIAESIHPLNQKIKEMQEHGATALGPAALVSIAMASRYTGSKVIICTDGQANIGLGAFEQGSEHAVSYCPYFYSQLAKEAVDKGVIVSVLTFEGTDCRLAEVGRLADYTGGRVNIVNISSVSTEIQSVLADSIMATDVTATLLSAEGVYFPYEDEVAHKLVRKLGNVTEGAEVTFQFAVKPENVESESQTLLLFSHHYHTTIIAHMLPFQLTDPCSCRKYVSEHSCHTSSPVCSLNMAVLGVHCAQLCARLTMEGRVLEAQKQLKAQQDLLKDIRPGPKEESIYGNWISTMSMICEDLSVDSQVREIK
uniref:Si:dkey-9k7.3 n=1 Tax=Scleropages formosus TaxID=113540 RepID=A0A8C9R254_SCLFO